ncbi:MAG: hypothetical protein JXR76_31215 [Deltaproteobacteria bacterium]|nr:hypothetical protein [Deltaproteobacteria bacterium]
MRVHYLVFIAFLLMALSIVAGGCATDSSSDDGDSSGTSNDSDSVVDVGETSANGTVYTQENATQCQETCAKMRTCDTDEFSDCEAVCAQMAVMLNSQLFDSLYTCVAAQDCAHMDPEQCMADGLRDVPDSVIDPFIDTLCDKVVSCVSEVTKDACIVEQKSDEEMLGFKLLNENALQCVGECLTDATCAQLDSQGDSTFESCMVACDAAFGDDEVDNPEGACSDIAGSFTMMSISCSGTDVDAESTILTQQITADCLTEISVTNPNCSMTYSGEFFPSDGQGTLEILSTCGEGCSAESCNTQSVPVEFDVSFMPGVDSLVLNFNVTQDVLDANMTPCALGSFNTTVLTSN